ncbi:MAG: hypothetical protein AAF449_03220 [Myxococcota bacterium]
MTSIALKAGAPSLLILWLAACSQTDVVADLRSADAGPCPPPVTLPGEGSPQMRADRWFAHGLCNCADAAFSAPFVADGFDSRNGPYPTTSRAAAGIEIRGRLALSDTFRVDGDLTIGADIAASTDIIVQRNLAVDDALSTDGRLEVGGDLSVNGALRASSLIVGGELRQPDGATRSVSGTVDVGTETFGAVSVESKCGCDGPLSFEDAIAAGEQSAENDEREIFANVDRDVTTTLACGVYAFSTLAGVASVTLILEGPTQIYVAGDISLGGLNVTLMPGATLDLFVRDGWTQRGPLMLGDPARPSAARIFADTTGTIRFGQPTQLYARVLAPRAEFVATGDTEIHGSLFVRRIDSANRITLHQDVNLSP